MFITMINTIDWIYRNIISVINIMFDSFIVFFIIFISSIIIIIFKSKMYKDESHSIPSFNFNELYVLGDEYQIRNSLNKKGVDYLIVLDLGKSVSTLKSEILGESLKSLWRDSILRKVETNRSLWISNNMLISSEDINNNWRSVRQSGCLASIYFYAACSIYYITHNEMVTNYHNLSDNANHDNGLLEETRSYNIRLGWDSLSKIFVLLVGFVFTFAFIANWSNIELLGIKGKNFILNLVGMEFLLIIVFLVTNMLLFYIFFESILPALFLLVGIYGAQQKIKAAFYLFLYTLFGSLFMLLVLLKLYTDGASLDMRKSIDSHLTKDWSIVGWMGLIFAFAVKTPLVPVHTWLPLAHSDANVSGSIILASVVLKLALYGILRLLIGILIGGVILIPTMLSWASLSTGYASLTTIRQFDLKVLVAYSSIAHMGSTLIGAFSNELPGIFGSILFGLAHGVVSPGLFILVGAVLYDRSGSRNIIYYRGLTLILPIFAVCFLLLVFANMGVPLTGNFLGEFLSYLGAYQENVFVVTIAALSIIFSTVYSIYMYNRVMSGSLSPYVHLIPDFFRKEFAIIAPLLFATFLLGIYPYFISYDIEYGLSSILLFSSPFFTFPKKINNINIKRSKSKNRASSYNTDYPDLSGLNITEGRAVCLGYIYSKHLVMCHEADEMYAKIHKQLKELENIEVVLYKSDKILHKGYKSIEMISSYKSPKRSELRNRYIHHIRLKPMTMFEKLSLRFSGYLNIYRKIVYFINLIKSVINRPKYLVGIIFVIYSIIREFFF